MLALDPGIGSVHQLVDAGPGAVGAFQRASAAQNQILETRRRVIDIRDLPGHGANIDPSLGLLVICRPDSAEQLATIERGGLAVEGLDASLVEIARRGIPWGLGTPQDSAALKTELLKPPAQVPAKAKAKA